MSTKAGRSAEIGIDVVKAIEKTGFPLEFHVMEKFRAEEWRVINNRYYIDLGENKVKEIDLVAYKVAKVDNLLVYFVSLVSCKKSESNDWAFITSELDSQDPNKNWQPESFYTNTSILQYGLSKEKLSEKIAQEFISEPGLKSILSPTGYYIGGQEIRRNTDKPQNDKPIF